MFKLAIDSDKCTGCQACALACSYHHTGLFNPKIASLETQRDEKRGKASILILKRERGEHIPCDGCAGEVEPLCVRYCSPGAIVALRGKVT